MEEVIVEMDDTVEHTDNTDIVMTIDTDENQPKRASYYFYYCSSSRASYYFYYLYVRICPKSKYA